MKEYDLYVPSIVKGRHFPAAKLASLEKRLIRKFGGLTYFPQRNKGFWKFGNATFKDDIVILRVISKKPFKAFWKKLKTDLQQQWNQKEILIVVRRVSILE